ncbi:MAG: DNA (cytosine-5-)-methyltransferase [Granulosicoccus sp.]
MANDLLIRDLSKDDLAWLKESQPPGTSQNAHLKTLLREVRQSTAQPSLFDVPASPVVVDGTFPFKFIDLFAGIGGFRSAMTAVGGQCVFTSEWDKYAACTYREWYHDDEVHTDDIRLIDPKDIPDHDVLCAGFPCQPFSLAGVSKKNSLGRLHGFDDEAQGNLFFSIMNIVHEKRPPILLLENVKNLRSHDKGNTWKVISGQIELAGYSIFHQVIDARHWVPQHRERVFIVCFDREVFGERHNVNFTFPSSSVDEDPRLGSILDKKAPDKKYMLSDKLWTYLQDYAEKHRAKGNGFGYSLFGAKDVARTLSARYHKDGSEILIKQRRWPNPRRLTPNEARQLMGFDNRYAAMFGHKEGFPQVVSDTQAYRQFGNSVVPLVVEAIGRQLVGCMADVFRHSHTGCLLKGRSVAVA